MTDITCAGCARPGPDDCDCLAHSKEMEAAQNYIIDLEYAVRELKSLCSYYCPEELGKSMSSELLLIEAALDVSQETFREKADA